MTKERALELLDSEDKSDIRYAIEELQKYPSKDIIRAIVKTVSKRPLKSILLSAKESFLTFSDLRQTLIDELKPLLYLNEPKLRNLTMEVFSYFGDDAIEYLDEFIESEDYNIRKYALDILSTISSEKSLKKVIKLIDDENPNVKYSAIEYLEYFRKFNVDLEEILAKEISKIGSNDMYGVSSIYATIVKGVYRDERILNSAKDRLSAIEGSFVEHYLYRIAIYEGARELIESATKSAKELNLEDDFKRDLEFISKEKRC